MNFITVAFQGEPGAYSEQAIWDYFQGKEVQPYPCESFEEVFEAVDQGTCHAGMIPIENSVAGSVHTNYDLLLRYQLYITGEHFLRVHHCLLALPGVPLEEIEVVLSHPQALSQCARTLRKMGLKMRAMYDTAGSIKWIQQEGKRNMGAIASKRAAQMYGMHILVEGIEDDPQNYTRFLEIRREAVSAPAEAKTSIVFSLQNQPGALFKALSVFALREIDLTKIESRPLVGKPWEYLFYLDFNGGLEEGKVRRALEHLREYALMLRVLGSYPRGQF